MSKHYHALTLASSNSRFIPSQSPTHYARLETLFVPNIASAKKNMRKSRAATVRNRAQRSALRTALKRAQASDATPANKLAAVKLLDRAARKGLIHKNTAARRKSQLTRAR